MDCCQELSGSASRRARPGKLVNHHHNPKYVHPICECYTFLFLSAIYSVRVRQLSDWMHRPEERVDELEIGVERPHENVCVM